MPDETATADTAPQWPRTIKLLHPVSFGTDTITELTFKRGTLGVIKGLKLSDEVPTDHLVTIASRLCDQPNKVIESLDVDDGGEVLSIALDFYARCLAAGKKR